MEAAAALHVIAVDPGLRVALPWRPAATGAPGPRARATSPPRCAPSGGTATSRTGCGSTTCCPGNSRIAADGALRRRAGRVGRDDGAARGRRCAASSTRVRSAHDAVGRPARAVAPAAMLGDIRDARARAVVARVLDEFERRATPVWPRLRAQVAHTDLTRRQHAHRRRGLHHRHHRLRRHEPHGARHRRSRRCSTPSRAAAKGAEIFRVARLVLDGYQRRVPLEDAELEVLGVAWAARSAVTIAISSWRVAQGLEEQQFAERYNADCLRIARDDGGRGVGRGRAAARRAAAATARRVAGRAACGGLRPGGRPAVLRRADRGGVGAEGVWITGADGRTYLDAYNNVPCVGHAHPRVTAAIARQSRLVNTHTRYLHPAAIELVGAAGGDLPAGARHGAARQLGLRGQRPRLAHRDRRHRARRRALHRLRLPRHHRGHGRALAGGVARRPAPRARRDVGSVAARRSGSDGGGRRASPTGATRRPPRSSTV